MEQYLGGVSSATSLTSVSPPPVGRKGDEERRPRNTRYYSLPCEGSVAQLPRTPLRRSSRRGSRRESGKSERPWESYERLLLHQLLEGNAVCPGDLRHGRHVGISLAGLQAEQGPGGYVGKLRRLLLRKTPLLPKNSQLHGDRCRHHITPLDRRTGAP